MPDSAAPTASDTDRSVIPPTESVRKRRQTVPLAALVRQGAVQAFIKLHPRSMMHNPVMFVT